METNVGQKDKSLRLAGAAVAALLALVLSGPLETVFWLVAALLVVTAMMGFCPAYTLLGKNTCGADEGKTCCGGNCHGDKAEDAAEAKTEDVAAEDKKDDDKAE